DARYVADLGLGAHSYLLHQDDLRAGYINSMKHGILYADAITTVSPTYASEIRTPQYGMGLDEVLSARGDAVTGILNGVDYDEWDPRHDRYLPAHYDAQRLAGKAEVKRALLARLGLKATPQTPLAGIVSRLVSQKGFDLLLDSLPRVLTSHELACAVLGNGEAQYERFFSRLQQDFPGRVAFHRGYSEELAHWI